MKMEIDENRLPYRTTTTTPFMLDIHATAGDCIALPYHFLEMVQHNPSDALLLTFAACEVRIEGRDLAGLYTALTQHRVEYIQENDIKYEKVDDRKPFISRIEIKPTSKDLELIVNGFKSESEPLVSC
ncbi:MAG TPA: hypothetical protein VGY56_15110 [Verrucomicrobiae bacterium]|nr:hypothetical protein [Verrucomicrobiae bacterium]